MPIDRFLPAALAAAALASMAPLAALAHTTIQVQASEGQSTYNNVVIGHGCLLNGVTLPVVAQSVLFPTVRPVYSVTGVMLGNPAVVSVSSFAGVAQLIQSRDVFSKQKEKLNARGEVIGFESTEGSLDPALLGLVPFRTAGITFPADSCASKLIVHVAIADICQKHGARNLWIPALTAKYADPSVDGIGSPASLAFNRDLAKNPLAPSCGGGYTFTVTPSAEDIDANLQVDGYLH